MQTTDRFVKLTPLHVLCKNDAAWQAQLEDSEIASTGYSYMSILQGELGLVQEHEWAHMQAVPHRRVEVYKYMGGSCVDESFSYYDAQAWQARDGSYWLVLTDDMLD